MESQRITQNGVTVYSWPTPHVHSFCLCLYLKAGPLYESDEDNGLTHFWEHTVFRSINASMGGKLFEALDRLGASFDACTYREFVQLQITAAPQHFEACAQILTRAFLPFQASAAEIGLEKKRIKSEIREENERTSLDFFTQQLVWAGTPLQNTITGRVRVLDRAGVARLARMHQQLLSTNNLFFYLTGAFGEAQLEHLAQLIEVYPLCASQPARLNLAPQPEYFFRRDAQVAVKNSAYHCVRFSFDVDVRRYEKPELDLLYDLLFTGDCSKLHQALSERSGLIYSYDSRLETYSNLGNLYFSYEVLPGRILESVQRVLALLQEVKTSLTDELELVRPVYTDNGEMLLDDPEELNWMMAYTAHILNQPPEPLSARSQRYRAVSAQRLMQVAQEVFRPENLILTLKTNAKKFIPAEARALIRGL